MKELSIEEKAKAYDEALERAREKYAMFEGMKQGDVLEDVFPELKESEDKKMWKLLKKYVHYNISDLVLETDHITREQLESWLEKQGQVSETIISQHENKICKENNNSLTSEDEKIRKEIKLHFLYLPDSFPDKAKWIAWLEKHKPVEHFELRAGHWYICHRAYCCRADHLTVKEGERFMCEKDGVVKGFVVKDAEKYFKECSAPAPMEDDQNDEVRRRSTIQVLEYARSLNTYNQYGKADIDKNIAWVEKQGQTFTKQEVDDAYLAGVRDTKQELKKISQRMISAEAKEAMYGKPTAWSEEDEKIFNGIILRCKKYGNQEQIDWLKSLRPQKQWKPSEKQMEALKEACDEHWEPDGLDPLYTLYQELKKLREE